MKHSIILLCPYFGKINQPIHSLWLRSCAMNRDIHFLILTDDESALGMPLPQNVKGITMRWDECVALVKSKLNFHISLNDPYKLCDLKPAYGYIFSEYVEGYDFWGHLDSSDTILGDLRKFVTDDILDSYDKVHSFGHLTLYRNTQDNNQRFLIPPKCGITIQELFDRPEVTGFDEMNHPWSINSIYKENGFTLLETIQDLVADIFPSKWAFQIVEDHGEKVSRVLEWNQGSLYDVTVKGESVCKREIGYVHFQKRKMKSLVPTDADHFYIVPNCFLPTDVPMTSRQIIGYSKDKIYMDPLIGRIKRIMNYAKRPDVFVRKLKATIKR